MTVIEHGQCWAAIRDGVAVSVIMMNTRHDSDFEEHRKAAIASLELLGETKSGVLVSRDGGQVFIQRLTHKNRSKSGVSRDPKEYLCFLGTPALHEGQI
jgi:hypothetical protein